MEGFIDTSVLVAAMVSGEAFHAECRALVLKSTFGIYSHGLTETFSTLTGGRKAFRLSAATAANMIEQHFVPKMSVSSLSPIEILKAMAEAEGRGVRGGAIFDFLHLVAAISWDRDRVQSVDRRSSWLRIRYFLSKVIKTRNGRIWNEREGRKAWLRDNRSYGLTDII